MGGSPLCLEGAKLEGNRSYVLWDHTPRGESWPFKTGEGRAKHLGGPLVATEGMTAWGCGLDFPRMILSLPL